MKVVYFSEISTDTFYEADKSLFESHFKDLRFVYLNQNQSNIKEDQHQLNFEGYSSYMEFFVAFPVIGVYIRDLIKNRTNKEYLKNWKHNLVYLLRSNYLARKLKSQCQYTDIVYTFWFNQLTLAAVIFKRRYNLEIKIVSRAHGRDLYNERDPLAYLPFQWYMLKHADLVAPISLHGSIYLNGYYSNKFENVNTFYLGSRKTLSKLHTTESKLNIFTVVTCCTVRNVKRLHLLPNILNHLNFEVRWVHFGGLGNEDDDSTITEFKNNCSNMKNHVLFLNKGACSLEEILDFYSKEQPDVLLSLSESEGLPVSMMEALSYGIPIVGTDVGGVSEIITTETGVLVSKDFTTQEYVKAINVIIKSNLTHNDSRKIIINYWNQKFNINKNYKSFFNYLEKEI